MDNSPYEYTVEASRDDCAKKCDDSFTCELFTFNQYTRNCRMYKDVGTDFSHDSLDAEADCYHSSTEKSCARMAPR